MSVNIRRFVTFPLPKKLGTNQVNVKNRVSEGFHVEYIFEYSFDPLTGTIYRPRVTWKCVGFRAIS